MGIRLSSGSRCPQSPKGLPLHVLNRFSVLAKRFLLYALTTLGLVSGCGSGGVEPNGANSNSLSAGFYAVNITAAGGSIIQTATINLTIQ